MDTLNLSERYWKGSSETSPQHGGGVGQPFRQSTTWRAHIPSVESLLARVRGNRTDRPGQVQNRRRWVFSRESSRVAAVIPVTISGIDEHDRIFREATQTIDVSRRGARIATSNALAVGTYLRIESPSMEKPTVAQVVRYCVRSHPDCTREICVALLDVVETHNIWGIQSPPEDWQTGLGEPTAAQRLGHILGCEWAARFKSISKVAAPPTGFAMGRESQPKPAPASLKPEVPPSSSEKGSGEGPVSVTSQPEEPVRVSASTLVCGDEGVLSGPDQIRKVPTSDVEERLTEVSLAVKALEGRVGTLVDRVGALVEDFQGRIEGTLQAFQGKGARQAEDLEKMAQDLGGRWSQQFQGQAEAAVERLQEELKSSGRVVEESKRQLASLAEAKLASLSQATREEYGQQLGQAFREHAQAMHEAADEEVESIRLAAEQAIAQLQAAEQKRETSFTGGAGAAEECLTGVSLAVEALEGRVGALVEDFQGRIEGTLQAFQGEGTRQAKDLEKMAQDLGGRWSQQFEEQGKAAVERLREELKNSGRVVEEGKRQLASLAKAKLASLSQATREEYGQQLAQAFREHAQVMHEAADEEVESIKLAAEQAIAQLQAAEEKRETSFTARAGAAEECLTGVSLAVEALEGRLGALVEDFQGRIEGTLRAFQGQGARQAGDLERMAQDMGGRWSQQFEEQAGAAVERLREELKSSGRAVEESKRELASLAKAKLLALSKVADNAAAGLEAEQRRLKNQYETSRRELEDLLKRGWTKPPSLSLQRGNRPKRRRIVAQPALVAGVCLLIMVPLLSVYLPKAHVMQLQPEAPAEFIDQSPYWSAERRAREEEVAQAYWRAAVVGLQERYPFGSELPAEPPTEFQVENEYIAPGGAKAFFETRARYWENLRRSWVQPQFWVERPERNTQWAARLRQIWDHLHPPK